MPLVHGILCCAMPAADISAQAEGAYHKKSGDVITAAELEGWNR